MEWKRSMLEHDRKQEVYCLEQDGGLSERYDTVGVAMTVTSIGGSGAR